jgi:hypothetical protein
MRASEYAGINFQILERIRIRFANRQIFGESARLEESSVTRDLSSSAALL